MKTKLDHQARREWVMFIGEEPLLEQGRNGLLPQSGCWPRSNHIVRDSADIRFNTWRYGLPLWLDNRLSKQI